MHHLAAIVAGLAASLPLASCVSPGSSSQHAETGAPPVPVAQPPFDTPDWANTAVLYQVNTRQFSEVGTFDAVRRRLPELEALGVTALWFKPIHPIGEVERKGTLGSPYAATDYYAVNPELGTAADFRALVEAAHGRGMRVILDFVANHTAWDHAWTRTNPDFYLTGDDGGFRPPNNDWTDVIQLDHDNPAMHEAMADAMVFWVREFNIDGFRLDVAGLVPMPFWNRVRAELDAIKPVFMLAEASGPEFHENAFDATYAWYFGSAAQRVVNGETTAADLAGAIERDNQRYPDDAIRMHFTSNHDWNSWNGTVFERYGDASATFAAMTFALDGMPLVYNGQEAGLDERLEFFERDPIDWRDHPKRDLYANLAQLKRRHPALHHGESRSEQSFPRVSDPEHAVAVLRRHPDHDGAVLFVANLSPQPRSFTVTLHDTAGPYTDAMSGSKHQLAVVHRFDLGAWGWRMLERE